ncbi:Uma2 family endonuclease [Dyadobacter sp. CY343]|uniref:Uma2 family endonuclease n=1 Tax=Dyadobacter sp. CY343 TaxID=2907299 RepID=UPI001F158E52|nr:Uma2 family endonuclease [Dyadobacter sp. CY343]MCE7058782.1 Uma2 family endonuclease [Dyadobacter sp. CY343]
MYSAEEYLELERAADYKSEYYRGEIFAMAGAGRNHNRIKENLSGEVYIALKGKSCQSFSSDMRVHIPENTLYTYPDLVILCGKPEFLDQQTDTLLNPSVIIEVLSSGTGEYDRGQKFHLYRSIPSLVEYVLIDSRKLTAEVHRKADSGLWVLASEAYAIDEFIKISHIGLQLKMSDIYAQTDDII